MKIPMKTKIFSIGTLGIMLLSLSTNTPISKTAFSYTDVSDNHEFAYEINYLDSLGLLPTISESTTNKFEPDKEATIVDLYAMLLSYGQVELTDQSGISLPYSDTSNESWYAPYIQTAINKDILRPALYNPTLNPERKIRKREVLSKLFDTLGVGTDKFFDETYFPFVDLDPSSTSAPYMFKAHQIGILEDDPTLARASKKITKGELAYMLYRIHETESDGEFGTYSINVNYNSKSIDNPVFDIFVDVWDTIKNSYYFQREVAEEEMLYNAIEGVIGTLSDPYTVFTTPDEISPLSSLDTEYEGVGMSVEIIDEEVTIISPFKGSPAEEAGVEPNDIILEVDGTSVDGMSLDTVVNMIKGPAGTDVKLKIKRGSTTKTITITRGYIFYSTVSLEFLEENKGEIAYVNVISFGEDTYYEFLEAAQQIVDKQQEDGDVLGIILDLRNNPGGYLDTAIEITGFFFDENTDVVILENSGGNKTTYYAEYYGEENEYDYGAGLLNDFETIVLVNDGSASASEIVAGALQDQDRAKIFGETTFGKGTVQEVFFYNDGSMFKLTVSKWFTPNGQDINHSGLTPDRTLVNSEAMDWQLDTAIEEFLD